MQSLFNFLTILVLLTSCSGNQEPMKTYNSLDVNLTKNELYVYDTKNSGDEEGERIAKQANHYSVSEIIRDSTFRLIYRYQPEQNYVGNDMVQLELSSGSDGASPSTHYEYITINFKIAE